MGRGVILDLCSGSGAWSQPYVDAGYDVHRIELEDGHQGRDVRLFRFPDSDIHGILAAPPCTVFSYARNRYPPSDNEVRAAISVVDACVRIATVTKPKWWVLENPINKVRWFLGPPVFTFRQWEYGDPAEKPTGLWGRFTPPMFRVGKRTKPSTFKTKKENASPRDGITQAGFAQAFFEANP